MNRDPGKEDGWMPFDIPRYISLYVIKYMKTHQFDWINDEQIQPLEEIVTDLSFSFTWIILLRPPWYCFMKNVLRQFYEKNIYYTYY